MLDNSIPLANRAAEPRLQARTVLVPLLNLSVAPDILTLAAGIIAGSAPFLPSAVRVLVLAVVPVPRDQPPAEGRNMARAYRALLGYLPTTASPPPAAPGPERVFRPLGPEVPVHSLIKVAPTVAAGIREAVRSEKADLLLLPWKGYARQPDRHVFGQTLDELLRRPPCDLVLARPGAWQTANRVLLPLRGGPGAEVALDLGLRLAGRLAIGLTVLHVVPRAIPLAGLREGDAPYLALADRLQQETGPGAPVVEQVLPMGADVPAQLVAQMAADDLVILGLAEQATDAPPVRGPVLAAALADPDRAVLVVRAARALDLAAYRAELARQPAAGVSAERWFVENTYHRDEFANPARWLEALAQRHAHVDVVLPTRNDGQRIVSVLLGLRRALQQPDAPLADEILVVDAASEDETAVLASRAGVPVLRVPADAAHPGPPGPAALLRQALNLAAGDILVWIDPKGSRLPPSYVPALAGPLLHDPGVVLVKPFWSEAPAADASPSVGAGHPARFAPLAAGALLGLTLPQLAAVPLHDWVRAFYPQLGALMHPLGRVFAARISLLRELLPDLERYEALLAGDPPVVSPGTTFLATLLLETAERHGVRAIAQVEIPRQASGRARRVASPDLRSLRQIADLLALFAARPDAAPQQVLLGQLRSRILSASA